MFHSSFCSFNTRRGHYSTYDRVVGRSVEATLAVVVCSHIACVGFDGLLSASKSSYLQMLFSNATPTNSGQKQHLTALAEHGASGGIQQHPPSLVDDTTTVLLTTFGWGKLTKVAIEKVQQQWVMFYQCFEFTSPLSS